MLLAFTDESYSSRRYFQGALIVDSIHLDSLREALQLSAIYCEGFGIAQGVEFHGHSIMAASKGWEVLGSNYRQKIAIFREILSKVSNTQSTLLIQGVDIEGLRNRYKYPLHPHEVTNKNLMDAVDRFAEENSEEVIIYSDKITMENQLASLLSFYRHGTTGGQFPRKLERIRSVEHVDSHLHPGIQIVDLCIYIFRRLNDHKESNPRTASDVENLWKILEPLIKSKYPPRIWRP